MQKRDDLVSASDFKHVYEDLGFKTSNLGCVMLDTEPLFISDIIHISELYYSDSPDHKYVAGIVSESVPHVTLLYGLMRTGPEMRKHIDEVMAGWGAEELEIDDVGYFESTTDGEPYYCIVAHIKLTENLLEAHGRLSFLPHVNTFIYYRPHITLAYIRRNEESRDDIIRILKKRFKGKMVKPTGVNYGE